MPRFYINKGGRPDLVLMSAKLLTKLGKEQDKQYRKILMLERRIERLHETIAILRARKGGKEKLK